MTVLITRTPGTEAELLAACADASVAVHWFSPLSIAPLTPSAAALAELQAANTVIVTSPNAARRLRQYRQAGQFQYSKDCCYLAVGAATAKALQLAGFENVIAPERGAGAEALTTLAEFCECRSAVIVKGAGGRDLIQRQLLAQGAAYTEVDLYQREQNANIAEIGEYLARLAANDFQQVVISSQESLAALIELTAAQKAALLNTELLVPSARIEDFARRQGFSKLRRTASALVADIMLELRRDRN